MKTIEVPVLTGEVLARFMERIQVGPGCWEWMGTKDQHRYGRFAHENRDWLAHRLAYAAFIGPIAPGELVLHHCDNPPCVSPAHLFAGSHQDNSADAANKGRFPWRQPVPEMPRLPGKGPLPADRIAEMRRLLREGYTQRQVARILGVDHSTVSRIHRGRRWVEAVA